MDPFGDRLDDGNSHELVVTNRCQMRAEIILKRLFNKLFNQVDALQPSELDDEFIYQSSITYDDYLAMVKQTQDDQISCASLDRLESILSNFMLSAIVRRPMHTSFLSNLWFSGLLAPMNTVFGGYSTEALNLHLSAVLFIVGLTAWFFNHVVGIRSWRAMPLSMILVGFIEFCMHKNQLTVDNYINMERCKNPSFMSRLASWVNYDYDGCQSGVNVQKQNIAFTGIEYLSELVLQPIVYFGEKGGKALQSYLNAFTGVNYLLAPLFPVILLIIVCIGLPLVWMYLTTRARHMQYMQKHPDDHEPIQSSIHSRNNNMVHPRNNLNNMIQNHR